MDLTFSPQWLPPSQAWGPYAVQTNGQVAWVLTDRWIGCLDVTAGMEDSSCDWVYCYRLEHWIWIDRKTVNLNSGSWAYIQR